MILLKRDLFGLQINDLKVVLSQLADEQAQLVAKNDGLVSKMETEVSL